MTNDTVLCSAENTDQLLDLEITAGLNAFARGPLLLETILWGEYALARLLCEQTPLIVFYSAAIPRNLLLSHRVLDIFVDVSHAECSDCSRLE